MPHSIKDIEKWKEEYPLLKDIWIKYDNFDKDVKNDTNISKYISVCSYFIKPWDEGKEEDKEFCTKLVRNLGHHSDNKDFLNYKTHDCLNLNNWIYNSMMKNNIQENIIKECFKEYDGTVGGMGKKPTCFYYEYDKTYSEPRNIIMLNIFTSNIHIFKNILKGEINSVHCSCQKFIEEVVSIYKYIKKTYCYNIVMGSSNTCQELTSFAGSYYYLYNDSAVKDKIPSLEYEKHANLLGCETGESLRGRPHSQTYQKQIHDQTYPEQKPVETFPPPQIDENNDSSNPISPTVSTALGTVAGASSLLALLYKVNTKIHLNMKTIIYNSFYTAITIKS
ncbi:hypothetical protein PVIIG_05407 [Plasmodium vivax India VII]|uniref:Uncharacterized protein n=1 Tax=Plasmodium vivax India VII TaxID=1077284 RepID=A0A0J9S288_PLAVI|nr:hypothetical protein PVIIG_05407 [Plasmodium vivax India VII]